MMERCKKEGHVFEMLSLSLSLSLTAGFERISGPQTRQPIDSNSHEAN